MSEKFIKTKYADGDVNYSPPSWRKIIDELNIHYNKVDSSSEDTKDHTIKEDEIALKHPTSGAIVKTTDEGYIDLFAGEQLGIRIDPITNTLNLFGDTVNILSKDINFRTKSTGLKWNGYSFNSQLYYEDEQEKEQVVSGTKKKWIEDDKGGRWESDDWSLKPMIKNNNKSRYSDGMVEMLKQLGLPVYEV
jgi:hypothetical protein